MSTDTPPTSAEQWLTACENIRLDHRGYGTIIMNRFYSNNGDKICDLTDKGEKIGRRWQFKDGSFCDFYLAGTGKAFTGFDANYKPDIITI